ncbi:MAG: hypothetical protein V2I63_11505 [Pseudomonadales bacterium]|jgi:hypothetical protein|nr:hypothetical protein [Pseudomonadales bacterium]
MEPLSELRGRFPIAGRLAWIGTRPARDRAMVVVEAARVDPGG